MLGRLCFIVMLFAFGTTPSVTALSQTNSWCRITPVPNAQFVPVATELLFRSDRPILRGVEPDRIHIVVSGSRSGAHAGRNIFADDNATMIFKPAAPFSPGESVSVHIEADAIGIAPLDFQFTVSEIAAYEPGVWAGTSDDARLAKAVPEQQTRGAMSVVNGVAVPSDFPKFTATTLKGTAKGKIFIGNWSMSGDRHYMMILENDGTPYYYKRLPSAHTRDFKLQPTGTLTRRVYDDLNCFVEMDSQYVNIDTLRCGHGYGTDEHEVQLLPNHHAFLIGLDYHQVDMSKAVVDGNPNATVIGNTVQELDEHHNVVFEWRSWDNYAITDAIYENLTGGTVDYVHMNSIAIDYDSNLVVSARHLSEVTKINRKTGKVMWRLGGVHNQFRFANDAYGLSYQHDVRPVPGKPNAYTMMDNGNHHSPNFSRAIELQLDTAQMVAIKVWEYRHTPSDYYTYFMGNVQRLSNGNTYIDWGDAPLPKGTEVTPSGEVVYEANFEKSAYAYRAFRFDWESVLKIPYLIAEAYPDRVSLIFNKFGDKKVKRYIVYAGTSPKPTTPIDSTTQTWIDLTNFTSGQTYYFRVTARDSAGVESPYSNEEKALVKITPPGANLVSNGDFSQQKANWQFTLSDGAAATSIIRGGEFTVAIDIAGLLSSNIQLSQSGLVLEGGKQYVFEFDAYASNLRSIVARVEQSGGAGLNYSHTGTLPLSTEKTHKSYPFTMPSASEFNARVIFNFGMSTDTVHIDNVSLRQGTASGVKEDPTAPVIFTLQQNFPNPFNPTTTIGFCLPAVHASYLTRLQIFDMLGRLVTTLVDEEKAPGTYTVQWNAAAFPSGMYVCTLAAQSASGASMYQGAKKILLVK
jgi:hypothetical protein